jgi:hypothetical protein
MKTVLIEKVNYFGDNGDGFNAKVLYRKNRKLSLCHIHIDFFNKGVYTTKQPKEGKVLKGFDAAIMDYAEKTRWNFC